MSRAGILAITGLLMLAAAPGVNGQPVFVFTEDFEDPDWFDGVTWTKEGADHPEIQVVQFSDGDARLNGASTGSAAGGLFASRTQFGQYTGGDHGEVYLDFHMEVPMGTYTFEVTVDQLVYWMEWPDENPGQLWGAGQNLHIGDAADLAYGSQQPNQAPLGPWVSPEFPGYLDHRDVLLGTHWQGSPVDANGVWVHRVYTKSVNDNMQIVTTGKVIFRMCMRNKYNTSENIAFALDNLEIRLTAVQNCHTPIVFDTDDDGDVDMDDFGRFQACYTGPDVEVVGFECACLDLDADGRIGESDFFRFTGCATRAGVPADPSCDD